MRVIKKRLRWVRYIVRVNEESTKDIANEKKTAC